MSITAKTGIDAEIRLSLQEALIESITKGNLHEHPRAELRNKESGDVLFRVDIDVKKYSGEVVAFLLSEWGYPVKEGFADKLTFVDRDGKSTWSMPPATRKSVTHLVPIVDYDYDDDDMNYLSYEVFLGTYEKKEITYHLPPKDGFVVITPECQDIEKAWREGGYHLLPSQSISFAAPSLSIN